MKMIGENEKGDVIYNELWCDICAKKSGPRTRFDDCGVCGATREQRLHAGHIGMVDMYLNSLKMTMEEKAKQLRKRFSAEIDVKIEFFAEKGDSSIYRKQDESPISKNMRTR